MPFNGFTVRLVEIQTEVLGAIVLLITQYGTEFNLNNNINYRLAGTVATVAPPTGQLGTEVTISGMNLLGYGSLSLSLSQVHLGDNQAEILSSSQTQVVVRASSGQAGSGSVQLNTTQEVNGVVLDGPYTSRAGVWTQLQDGQITEITPPAAQVGSLIYLCGNALLGGGSSIVNVTFIGTTVSNFSSSLISDPISGPPTQCISAVVPPLSGGLMMGEVNLTADTSAIIVTQPGISFEYASLNPPSPSLGQEFTQVVITGIQLLSGYNASSVTTTVHLSGVLAQVIDSAPEQVTVSAGIPSQSVLNVPGDVEVSVTFSGLMFSVSLTEAWTYRVAGQIVTVTPPYGQHGTRIIITGSNLLGYGNMLDEANFTQTGTTPVAATIASSSATQVVLSVPSPATPGYTGSATIQLIADNGARVTGVGVFEYRTPGSITGVQPSSGQNGTFGKLMMLYVISKDVQ